MDVNHPAPKVLEHRNSKHRKETSSTPEEETPGQETHPQAGRWTQTILQEPIEQAENSHDTSLRKQNRPCLAAVTDNR